MARIGFYSEITIAGAAVVAFFLGVLFALGTDDVLYNAAFARIRLMAYSVLVGYLLGATALLLWAVNRWMNRSRSAYLVAPLIIITTGAAILVFMFGSAII